VVQEVNNMSEVARLREQIAAEYMSAKWGLTGLAYGTAKHSFITARMENMQTYHAQLQTLVHEQATPLVAETLEAIPDRPTRAHLLSVMDHELGPGAETERVKEQVQAMWETLDLLVARFGKGGVHRLLEAPALAADRTADA